MTVYIVNSFVHEHHGGNAAGVVIVDNKLSTDEMQAISKEVNLSETAFVFPINKEGHYPIRFFTPVSEVPLCGHATLAAFHMLKSLSLIISKTASQVTGAGILKIKLDGDQITMLQPGPKHRKISSKASKSLNDLMGLGVPHSFLPTEVWSTGLEDVLLPIPSRSELNNLNVDFHALSRWSGINQVVGVHAFAIEGDTVYARNFAPLYGIDEEAATGTSNGALIAYLHHYIHQNQSHLKKVIYQGESMAQKSAITALSVRNDTSWEIWVGGKCKLIKVLHLYE